MVKKELDFARDEGARQKKSDAATKRNAREAQKARRALSSGCQEPTMQTSMRASIQKRLA